MRQIRIFNDETHAPADLEVGERVELIRAGGPLDGTSLGFAVITQADENGVAFDAEGTTPRKRSRESG